MVSAIQSSSVKVPDASKRSGKQKFSWKEVARHNTKEDAWVSVRGKVYNITNWIEKHPGGQDMLLLSAGRDATNLVETYHRNLERAMQVLAKYEIGVLVDNELPVFRPQSEFFHTLKKRVYEHFGVTGQNPKFHWMMIVRYAVVILGLAVSFYLQFFYPPVRDSTNLSVISALLLGLFCAQVGLLPLHDASHCAFTNRPYVWRILGSLHDFLNGASYWNWCYQHTLGHHPYTNVIEVDPDISTSDPDIRRIKYTQKWYSRYIYQHLFVPILYGLLGMKVRIQDINILYILKTQENIRVNPLQLWNHVVFWGGKAFFVFYRIILPLWAGLPITRVLGLFAVSDLMSSYWLAFTFQASHVVDGVEWLKADKNNEIDRDWAEIQVTTAQDYSHKSWFWTNFTGALNFQVAHHIFPNISQHYYPEIAPIIIETCKEFGIRYTVKDSYISAFAGHLRHLKQLGQKDDRDLQQKIKKK